MKQETQITNRYRIISKLGQGGMGAVWRVYDRLEKSEVVLKQVLIPDKQLDFASKAGTDDTGNLRLSLAQEFSILATLRHPHILSVLDFGLAKQDKAQSTNTDTISGTISYMAPELFQGTKASVASDLFAIGVMVYEIMVGQHPYAGDHVGQTIMKIMTHTPDFSAIPDDFVPWLQTILEKDPANRFSTTYDAMVEFYDAVGVERPAEDQTIRESFLQASEFVGRDAELKQLTAALETLATQNAFGMQAITRRRLSKVDTPMYKRLPPSSGARLM